MCSLSLIQPDQNLGVVEHSEELVRLIISSGDESVIWRCAFELYFCQAKGARKLLTRRLVREPAGERQVALMQALGPSADLEFVRMLRRIIFNLNGTFEPRTREIAASRLGFASQSSSEALNELHNCLKLSSDPILRFGALKGAWRALRVEGIAIAIGKLVNDRIEIRGRIIGDVAALILDVRPTESSLQIGSEIEFELFEYTRVRQLLAEKDDLIRKLAALRRIP